MLALVRNALTLALRRQPKPGERPERDGLVGVRKGEPVRGLVVAPRLQQALATFGILVAILQNSPKLSRYIESSGATQLTLKRDDGQLVTIQVLAAAARGTNLRGGWFVGAVFDEADFFNETDATVTLNDQLKAVKPALIEGGQIWLTSSPWDESGDFAKAHADAFGRPGATVAFHSDTPRMNPTYPVELIEEERAVDPDYVSREYDAVPMLAGSGQFFSEMAIATSCVLEETFPLPPNGAPHWAGADPGLRKNSATLALARRDAGRAVLAYYEELVPQRKTKEQALADIKRGVPPGLAPSVVFTSFARTAMAYKATSVRGDQYYNDSAIEWMPTVTNPVGDSVWYDTFVDNADSTAEIFTKLKGLMLEGKAVMPRDPRLMQQLRDTKIRKGPSGKTHVALPKTGAAHGDLLKAVVLAMVQVPLELEEEIEEEPYDTFGMSFDEGRGF